jgi:hypothetical protein
LLYWPIPNRRRRSYGLSWSRETDVADSFARSIWQTFECGILLHSKKSNGSPLPVATTFEPTGLADFGRNGLLHIASKKSIGLNCLVVATSG